jgi:hypothetical protein
MAFISDLGIAFCESRELLSLGPLVSLGLLASLRLTATLTGFWKWSLANASGIHTIPSTIPSMGLLTLQLPIIKLQLCLHCLVQQ